MGEGFFIAPNKKSITMKTKLFPQLFIALVAAVAGTCVVHANEAVSDDTELPYDEAKAPTVIQQLHSMGKIKRELPVVVAPTGDDENNVELPEQKTVREQMLEYRAAKNKGAQEQGVSEQKADMEM